jgi:ATP-dependent Clp protease ATP-binding subunit ClpC
VSITDGALIAAAQLADQNLPGSPLPTKALDLLDEAASSVQMRRLAAPKDLQNLYEEIAQVRREKESAIDSRAYEAAAALRGTETQLLLKKAAREKEWKATGNTDVATEVNEEVVVETLAIMSGGSSAGIVDMPQSRRQDPPYPPTAMTDDDREIWAMA